MKNKSNLYKNLFIVLKQGSIMNTHNTNFINNDFCGSGNVNFNGKFIGKKLYFIDKLKIIIELIKWLNKKN